MIDILDKAIIFATKAHSGAIRKGSATPYILHPMEAAAIVGTMTDDKQIIAAAMLHDILEDTAITAEQLRLEFGETVAILVETVSENKRRELPSAETWHLRKQETIDALLNETRLPVIMITLGDKLSNIRATYRDMQTIGEEIWDRFNQKDKAEHGWYYRSIIEATRALKKYPVWQEYAELVHLVFD